MALLSSIHRPTGVLDETVLLRRQVICSVVLLTSRRLYLRVLHKNCCKIVWLIIIKGNKLPQYWEISQLLQQIYLSPGTCQKQTCKSPYQPVIDVQYLHMISAVNAPGGVIHYDTAVCVILHDISSSVITLK